MRELDGVYKMPELQKGQSYYCNGLGCGPCGLKTIDEWHFREIQNGIVVREQYHTVEVADCCGGDAGIWDDVSDSDVPFEMISEEAP